MNGVSISDMQRVALGGESLRLGGNDIGDVIELGDLSDDLGLNMLMNPSKVGVSASQESNSARVVRMDFGQGQGQGQSQPPKSDSMFSFGTSSSNTNQTSINPIPLEPLEPISLSSGDVQPIDMNTFGGPPVDVGVQSGAISQGSV